MPRTPPPTQPRRGSPCYRPAVADERLSSSLSGALLIGLLLVVGLGLAALGSAVMLPQGGAVVLFLAGGGLAFLGLQLLVFRLIGLRSKADDPSDAGPDHASKTEVDEDEDWRAWRG
jgi:hypothetical protein